MCYNSLPTFTCLKSTTEKLEEGMKYVQTRMKSMTFVTYNLYAGVVFIIAIFRYELPKNFVNTNCAFF